MILTLVSDVAADYFQLLELDRELAIAQESVRTYKKTLDLFNLRFTSGKDSRLPVERAQAAYDASNADIQDLKRRIAQQENAISTLVGAFPRTIARGHPLVEQSTPQTPLGSTTALLQRRPDILQAEQGMIAANAEIGVAVANFYPRIGLSTFLGGEGINLAGMWGSFGVWNLAATLGRDCRTIQADDPRRIPRNLRRVGRTAEPRAAARLAPEPGHRAPAFFGTGAAAL